MRFLYQARTKEGELREGRVEASNKEAALELLQKLGLYVINLKEEKPSFFTQTIKIGKGISEGEIVVFFRQLAILLEAGVSLTESLLTLSTQTGNPNLREKLVLITEKIEAGTAFSNALSLFPDIFSPFVISIVKNGEAVGKLPFALSKIADHLERDYNFKQELIGLMIYPLIVFIITLFVLFLLLFGVFPTFESFFLESNLSIPLITRIVLKVGNFLKKNILYLGLGGIILFFFLVFVKRFERTKKRIDQILLKIPILSPFLKKIYLTKIAEMWGVLIGSGISVAETLELSKDIVENSLYQEAILKIKEGVKAGTALSFLLYAYPSLFPPFFTQIVAVGEKTGRLDQTLTSLAQFQQNEIDRGIKKFLRFLEPFLIALMGVFVGGLVGSVFIPLYKMIASF